MEWAGEIAIWRAEHQEAVVAHVLPRARRVFGLSIEEALAKVSQAWTLVEPMSPFSWERRKARSYQFQLRWARIAVVLCEGGGPSDGLRSDELLPAWLGRHREVPVHVAEDVIQEALVKVFGIIRSRRMREDVLSRLEFLEGYVLRTADNCFIDRLRRQGLGDRRSKQMQHEQPTVAAPADEDADLELRLLDEGLAHHGLDDEHRRLCMGRARGESWKEIAQERFAAELEACEPGQREEDLDRYAARLRQQFNRLLKRYPGLSKWLRPE